MENKIVKIINNHVVIIEDIFAEVWKDGQCIGAGIVPENISPDEVFEMQYNGITD